MKRLHIALSANDIEETIKDYSKRIGSDPTFVVPGEYALWRTENLNISVRKDDKVKRGMLRHLGWEDENAKKFSAETDVNEILWENFSAEGQADEINELWPDSNYKPS